MNKSLLCYLALFLPMILVVNDAMAQKTVEGKVTSSDDGSPLPGVNVLIKNTTRGTSTDFDGNYRIELLEGEESLVFSFVGYSSQEVEVGNRSLIDVTLMIDINELQEIVVVGYGTQEVRELTSAISTVDPEEIVKTPTGNAMQALQGRVPGLQIVNNGAPGAAPEVRVRGFGGFTDNDLNTNNEARPLFVVDGMFVDNIDFLNTADIASISVLKDASASAIYGVRAANGVILIETKSGDFEQATQITYDGYYGVQVAQDVLQMANTEQFANYIRQTGETSELELIDNAIDRFGRSRVNPDLPVTNTDWYNEIIRDAAPIQSHSLTITGGTKQARYSVGASYFEQDGLMDHMRNSYERLNFRAKVDAIATDWLTVGGNVTLSNATQFLADDAAWFQGYFAVPTLPVFDELNTAADPIRHGNAQTIGYRSRQNPFFVIENNDDRNNIGKIIGNFYADIELIPNKLSFKTSYNYFYQNIVTRNVRFDFSDGVLATPNELTRINNRDYNQISDNILTYRELFGDHSLDVTAGYSFRSEVMEGVQARGVNIRTIDRDDESTWYIPDGSEINVDETFDTGAREFGSSYFGRVSYSYKNRYLLSGSYRRDGTNKFQEKWGDFFTISGGWVVTDEAFFDVPGIDFLKVRAGWGQMGNDDVAPAIGQTTFEQISVPINDQLVTGVQPDNVFDIIDRWETVEETNIGLTARFLNNRLSLEADVFRRDTEDAVLNVEQRGTGEEPRRNAGAIRNQGIEILLSWSDQVSSDLSYNISANLATLDNEVLSVGDQPFLLRGSDAFRQRSEVGSAVNEFYGYEIVGVFQTENDITNSGYTEAFITDNDIIPGDFFFRDQNSDGVIDANDRVFLGSFLPSYTFGVNLGVTYKQFSFSAYFQGQGGNTIMNRKRGEIIFTQDTNIDADLANNFWTEAGSTNEYPSAAGYRKSYNNSILNEFLLEDGDYFRVQNVRLSYLFDNKEVLGLKLPRTTVSVTAERPLTIFDYNGFNPEVVNGVDRQTYPVPAVYTFGLNVQL